MKHYHPAPTIEDQLAHAAETGNAEEVLALLERGADVHERNDLPLRSACHNGHAYAARILLDHGANVHACDDEALYWAVVHNHSDTIAVLKNHIVSEETRPARSAFRLRPLASYSDEEILAETRRRLNQR